MIRALVMVATCAATVVVVYLGSGGLCGTTRDFAFAPTKTTYLTVSVQQGTAMLQVLHPTRALRRLSLEGKVPALPIRFMTMVQYPCRGTGPWRMTAITCPMWLPTVFIMGLWCALTVTSPRLERWRRRKRGLCTKCGYNLTGNISGICPECGVAVMPVPRL